MVDKTAMANKTFRVVKTFRVSVDNRNVRLEKGLECQLIDETFWDYLLELEHGLSWWVPKDKLSTYFEEVGVEPKQP